MGGKLTVVDGRRQAETPGARAHVTYAYPVYVNVKLPVVPWPLYWLTTTVVSPAWAAVGVKEISVGLVLKVTPFTSLAPLES
jgi:hypothetical protein